MKVNKALCAGAVAIATTLLAGACTSTTSSGDAAPIGEAHATPDSPFWNAYARYLPQIAKSWGVEVKEPAAGDGSTFALGVGTLLAQGARALVLAPGDAATLTSTLAVAAATRTPVVSIDVEPDQANVFMVVRVEEKSYGERACTYIGAELRRLGKDESRGDTRVVVLEGDSASANTRDRTDGFNTCMRATHPQMKIDAEQTNGDTPTAIRGLDAALAAGKVDAIYLQSSNYLEATLSDLQAKGLLKPRGQHDHIVIVSTDGVAAEIKAIKEGSIDATVSQPATLYASYGVYYAQQAVLGKTFSEGKTDHDSTIVKLPDGNLEDQLRAPLVTFDGGGRAHALRVDDPRVLGNQSG